MNFDPAATGTLGPGTYAFKVKNSVETVSSKGNDMIELTLDVKGNEIRDWLVAKPGLCIDKIRQFCACVGLVQEFEAGILGAEDCYERVGKAEVKLEPDDNGNEWPRVVRYLPRSGVSESLQSAQKTSAPADQVLEELADTPVTEPGDVDEIPF